MTLLTIIAPASTAAFPVSEPRSCPSSVWIRSCISASAVETERLGAELASGLRGGDVVLISGDLGAGKTTFVRGAARVLGVSDPVTSPTFTIGQRYVAAPPVAFVSHIDLYRLRSLADEDPDLLADYIGADTITFVEWPDAGAAELAALGRIARRVELSHTGGDGRLITISPSMRAITSS
jgi:tRNA threonylcarbamoyladenosine biosynthesis protein TsaE